MQHEMTQREELPDERDLGGVGIVRVGMLKDAFEQILTQHMSTKKYVFEKGHSWELNPCCRINEHLDCIAMHWSGVVDKGHEE